MSRGTERESIMRHIEHYHVFSKDLNEQFDLDVPIGAKLIHATGRSLDIRTYQLILTFEVVDSPERHKCTHSYKLIPSPAYPIPQNYRIRRAITLTYDHGGTCAVFLYEEWK